MIKAGDKVICIKTVLSFDKTGVLLEEGQIYTVEMYPTGCNPASSFGVSFYKEDFSYKEDFGYYFPYTSKHNEVKYYQIEDCIITLAEWREQQMKKLLDG